MSSSHDPFGVLAFLHWDHAWNNRHFKEPLLTQALQRISELGVRFVRMDILWSDVYAGPFQYNFSRYDRIISDIRARDIEILALLHYNKAHSDEHGEIWNKPPDSLEEFAHYAGETVSHFKHQIRHWEIWNEPNHPLYWAAPPDRLRRYSELLRASYRAVKKNDPFAVVLNGGLAHPIPQDLQNLYAAGGKEIMDVVSIHPFLDPFSNDPKSQFDRLMEEVRSVMQSHQDGNKKIWITEMGCPGMPSEKMAMKWFQGKAVSEEQQAKWLETQFSFLKDHPTVEKMFWAFFRDIDGILNEGADYLGLIRFDLSPKPAFHRFKKIINDSRGKTGNPGR